MVFHKAPLNICSRCCPFLPHKLNTVCLNPFLEYKCVFIREKVRFSMEGPSQPFTSILAATSLPREWSSLWLPGWTASHLSAGPKSRASHHCFPQSRHHCHSYTGNLWVFKSSSQIIFTFAPFVSGEDMRKISTKHPPFSNQVSAKTSQIGCPGIPIIFLST